MVPASAGRREPKKILHSELQGCDIFRELGEQRGAGGNAKCWGGSPFAGGKMLNAWGGPDTHGGGWLQNDVSMSVRRKACHAATKE